MGVEWFLPQDKVLPYYDIFPYIAWSFLIIACWISPFLSIGDLFKYGKLANVSGTNNNHNDNMSIKQSLSDKSSNGNNPQQHNNSQHDHTSQQQHNKTINVQKQNNNDDNNNTSFLTHPIFYTSHASGFGFYYKMSVVVFIMIFVEFMIHFELFPAFILNTLTAINTIPSNITQTTGLLLSQPIGIIRYFVTQYHIAGIDSYITNTKPSILSLLGMYTTYNPSTNIWNYKSLVDIFPTSNILDNIEDWWNTVQDHPVDLLAVMKIFQKKHISFPTYNLLLMLYNIKFIIGSTLAITFVFFQVARRLYETWFVHVQQQQQPNSSTQTSTTKPTTTNSQERNQLHDNNNQTSKGSNLSQQHIAVTLAGSVYYILVIVTPILISYIGLLFSNPSHSTSRTLISLTTPDTSQLYRNVTLEYSPDHYITQQIILTLLTFIFSSHNIVVQSIIRPIMTYITPYIEQIDPIRPLKPRVYELTPLYFKLGTQEQVGEVNPMNLFIPSSEISLILAYIIYCILAIIIPTYLYIYFWCKQYQCHVILAELRKPDNNNNNNENKQQKFDKPSDIPQQSTIASSTTQDKRYSIPTAGWFRHITCPHYLAEIGIYFSLYLITPYTYRMNDMINHIVYWFTPGCGCQKEFLKLFLMIFLSLITPMFLCLIWVASNLWITAQRTHLWYITKFGTRYIDLKKNPICPKVC